MCVVTAVGAAGVPGGSIPLLVMVLEMVGVPGAGIALILGVDRILDMARTVPNVTGDLLTSLVIARSEGSASEARGTGWIAPDRPDELDFGWSDDRLERLRVEGTGAQCDGEDPHPEPAELLLDLVRRWLDQRAAGGVK